MSPYTTFDYSSVVCYISYNAYIGIKNIRSTNFKLHLPLYLLLDIAMVYFQVLNIKNLINYGWSLGDMGGIPGFAIGLATIIYSRILIIFNLLWEILNWSWYVVWNYLLKYLSPNWISIDNMGIAFFVTCICIPPSLIGLLHYYVNYRGDHLSEVELKDLTSA